jgi:AAA domain
MRWNTAQVGSAEVSCLGIQLAQPDLIGAAWLPAPLHYIVDGHEDIARALNTCGAGATLDDVCDALAEAGRLEPCGGRAYVKSLGENLPRGMKTIERNATRVVEAAQDRAAEAVCSLREKLAFAEGLLRPRAAPFSAVDLSSLGRDAPPAPTSWWGRYLPAGEVTGAGGHGEVGKSTVLGIQLGAHLAVGAAFLGHDVRRARVAYYSAEDPPAVVLHRLDKACRIEGLDVDAVRDGFHVLDASEGNGTLFVEQRTAGVRVGTTTAAYAALTKYVADNEIDVVIVDNTSDVFESDEISRSMVRKFIRSLAQIVRPRGGSVVLLMHVDKSTARGLSSGSDNYSGSTAWHNSVRSRLFLKATDEGGLELRHEKCNYGPKHAPIALRWPADGMPELDRALSPVVQHIADRTDAVALITLIHEFYGRGEWVATGTSSPSNAARVLSNARSYPKRRKPAEVFEILRDAERHGQLARETYRTNDRKERERWALTAEGCGLIGAPAPTAPTAPTYMQSMDGADGAGGAPTAPTSGVGGVGGAARAQKLAQEVGDVR